MDSTTIAAPSGWPELDLDAWEPTRDTLHLWTQVVGKIRLALAPPVNHWWHTPLYITARGLTTSPMPRDGGDSGTVQIDFDFLQHRLMMACSDGQTRSIALEPRTVADFHAEVMAKLAELGVHPRIWTTPVEIPDPIPFEQDTVHSAYDPEYAQRFWRVLLLTEQVMNGFRWYFLGKCSPVHFFWGSFDLAVTRFSGRPAPRHPGAPNVADHVTREAYSHEVISVGFWPGGGPVRQAVFYAYAYPEPAGLAEHPVRPPEAYYSRDMGEFLLPYDAVRTGPDPAFALREFLDSTYTAAADLAGWDRTVLERQEEAPE